MDIINIITKLSKNYTKAIHIIELKNYQKLALKKNGTGNRFACQKFNYCFIYKNLNFKIYSENNDNDINYIKKYININYEFLTEIINSNNTIKGIHFVFIFSLKSKKNDIRTIYSIIKKSILEKYENTCVICNNTNSKELVIDHKNDLYNDKRVLNVKTQTIEDFQLLCNKCNLKKRQILIKEKENKKIYYGYNIPKYKKYYKLYYGEENYLKPLPFEPIIFNLEDINCKIGSYYYDIELFEFNLFSIISK